MDPINVTLFVFDEKDNFEKSKKFIATEGASIKKMICIEDLKSLEEELITLDDDDYVSLVVHVFGTSDNLKGIKSYRASGIERKYPKLKPMYITDSTATKEDIKHKCINLGLPEVDVNKYHYVTESIAYDKNFYTKGDIVNITKKLQFDYAIIAALYENEFVQLQKIFEFPKDKKIEIPIKTKSDKFIYHEGHLISNPNKKVIVAVQRKTGMIDASIIATQMLEMFNPKYLLMSGVCGGGCRSKYGDVIVANEVFTFQRGKISDITQKNEEGENIKIQLYDKDRNIVDYDHLYDESGKQIKISIEKFEKEPDPIDLKTHIIENIIDRKTDIESEINKSIKQESFVITTIEVKIEPIACSTMVINKDGFFEDTIRTINRNTAAVEMESYGVARACHFANKGETIPIIFKSVMDFTKNKEDAVNNINVKAFAAWTSAQFMKCLFEMNII